MQIQRRFNFHDFKLGSGSSVSVKPPVLKIDDITALVIVIQNHGRLHFTVFIGRAALHMLRKHMLMFEIVDCVLCYCKDLHSSGYFLFLSVVEVFATLFSPRSLSGFLLISQPAGTWQLFGKLINRALSFCRFQLIK